MVIEVKTGTLCLAMTMSEHTRMIVTPSHEYFSSFPLIVVYGLLELHTAPMHLVILGCFNFYGLVPDPYKHLTSFDVEFHQSVTHGPFLPSFEHLVNFVCLMEERGNSFSLPTSSCHSVS